MKKLRIYEAITLCLIVIAGIMVAFGYTMASDSGSSSQGSAIYTSEYIETLNEPYIISPTTGSTIYGEQLNVKIYAPNSLTGSGHSQIFNIINSSTLTPMLTREEQLEKNEYGVIIFPTIGLANFPDGAYSLRVELSYPDPYNTTILISRNVELDFMVSHTTISTSTTTTTKNIDTNTSNTTVTTRSTAVLAPKPTTTTTTKPPISIVDEQLKATNNSNSEYIGLSIKEVQGILIKQEEEKKLPQELRVAPEVTVLKTTNAEVNMVDDTKGTVKLTGKAEPNQLVYLYIFSEPIVVSVQTDGNGDWEYNLDKELATGEHKVYVAVKNDDSTVKAKSSAFSFIIGQAIAASPTQNQNAANANSANYLYYYIMFAVSIVTLIVSMIFFVLTKKKIKQHALQLQG